MSVYDEYRAKLRSPKSFVGRYHMKIWKQSILRNAGVGSSRSRVFFGCS